MAGQRVDITMTEAEVSAFLSRQSRVVVVGVDDTGPVATVGSARLADGQWMVTVPRADLLSGVLERDDRVCVIADDSPDYGKAPDDPSRAGGRYVGVTAHGRAVVVPAGNDELAFSLALDDLVTWDFNKQNAASEGTPG